MRTLLIKDLPLDEEMGANAMATVRGGFIPVNNVVPNLSLIAYPTFPPTSSPPHNGGPSSGDGGGGGSGFYNNDPYGDSDLHEQD
jgi:hypothetical protein